MGDRTTTGAAYPLHRSTSTPIAAVPDSAATVAHWQAMPLPPPPLTRFERNTLSSASTLSFANSFGSSDGTIIPTLSHKHSAWSLADHKAGPEACIPPPKRSWRTSYEVW
ncbi:hypothetical protein IWQ60_008344 [Tieghemiomyces parasiticus]|uniref:Uncharacterized protein n=1 Tax=Tieghemiomyces parasiticus TaxID=78921 RepID=A0A9W8DN98_9FUNG|nr:hypothetical protein IWQ60_008344 [Tieghemiomyces parasiticus]